MDAGHEHKSGNSKKQTKENCKR